MYNVIFFMQNNFYRNELGIHKFLFRHFLCKGFITFIPKYKNPRKQTASRSCKLLQMLENLTKLSTFNRGGLQENSCTDNNEKRHGNSAPYP